MRLVIDLTQILEIQVGVDLRGGKIGMAEQFLDGAQIAAGFQHVGGEGVSQGVWVDMGLDPLQQAPAGHPVLDAAMTDAFALFAEKQCRFGFGKPRVAHLQPALECCLGLASDETDASFVAFANDLHFV